MFGIGAMHLQAITWRLQSSEHREKPPIPQGFLAEYSLAIDRCIFNNAQRIIYSKPLLDQLLRNKRSRDQ